MVLPSQTQPVQERYHLVELDTQTGICRPQQPRLSVVIHQTDDDSARKKTFCIHATHQASVSKPHIPEVGWTEFDARTLAIFEAITDLPRPYAGPPRYVVFSVTVNQTYQ